MNPQDVCEYFIFQKNGTIFLKDRTYSYSLLKKVGKEPGDLNFEIQQKIKQKYQNSELLIILFEITHVDLLTSEVSKNYEYNIIYNENVITDVTKLFFKALFQGQMITFNSETEIDLEEKFNKNKSSNNTR